MTKAELGALAVHMLLDGIEGRDHQNPFMLSHELVIRESAP
jgi:DNA-binding LacI/PurR family transcriptional regulator